MLGVERGNSDEKHEKDDCAGRQRRGKEHVPAHNVKLIILPQLKNLNVVYS